MVKMFLFLIVLINTISMLNGLINVSDKFFVCNNSTKILNTEEISFDMRLRIKLRYQDLVKNEDEFHFIQGKTDHVIIYSNQQSFFATDCIAIQHIIIQDSIKDTTCINDLYVAYYLDGSLYKAFMTKSGVLRRQTREIRCENSQQVYNSISKHFQVLKINQNVSATFFFNVSNKIENQPGKEPLSKLLKTASNNETKNKIESQKSLSLVSEEKNNIDLFKIDHIFYEQIQLFVLVIICLLLSLFRIFQCFKNKFNTRNNEKNDNTENNEKITTHPDINELMKDLTNQVKSFSGFLKQNENITSTNLEEFKEFCRKKNFDFELNIIANYKNIQDKLEEILLRNSTNKTDTTNNNRIEKSSSSDSVSSTSSTSQSSQTSSNSIELKMRNYSSKQKSEFNKLKKKTNYK
jgi:hypothetical protein